MALSRITDDVLLVIIDALKIEDIILLGATGRRLRTVTTNERRVWAPRLFTKELGLGTVGLDAAAYASLTSLGCSPRRLLLQSLPWRVVRDGSDDGKGKAYSWRPRGVPAGLLLSAAQDFVFCEIYEHGVEPVGRGTYFSDGFARKIVRLEDCDLTHFPDNVIIPLDIPTAGHHNGDPWYEVRLFVVVDGVLAPMGDTGHCDGDANDRYQDWNSGLLPLDDQGQTWINVNTDFHTIENTGGDSENFQSLRIEFNECEEDWRGRKIDERLDKSSFLRTPVLDPKFWFRNYFRSHAIRAQPTKLFATDSMTPLPFSPDAAFLRARRKTEMATARAAAAEAALEAKRAEQAALEAELAKIKASVAELEKIKASAEAEARSGR
tara:strand:+ start:239 stop:1375 length:1137 start_codon:yes stop_codon:yes gene_type:complete